MKYIQRRVDSLLLAWMNSKHRKPLLLRGARQVGKSSSVRHLGEGFRFYLEINFELDIDIASIFTQTQQPDEICNILAAAKNVPIVPGETLLFLDEIQACPEAITALRFFYEKMPNLHVIAAGSLLEFALQSLSSFGVGRIHSIFMYPFSFDEFLIARDENLLLEELKEANPDKPLSPLLHKKCTVLLTEFISVGGMPEVIATFCANKNLMECQQILDDIIISMYGDFAKYGKRINVERLRATFGSVIHQTGSRFVCAGVMDGANSAQIKECLYMLTLAQIVYPVTHSSGNGIPLVAEENPKYRKYLILDTGLYQRYLRVNLGSFAYADSLQTVNKGALAELFAGLELIKRTDGIPELHYWQREVRGSNAEVDYLVQEETSIVPIEVKSGTKGAMQSMNLFLNLKKITRGVRTSYENFGRIGDIDIIPLYALGTCKL